MNAYTLFKTRHIVKLKGLMLPLVSGTYDENEIERERTEQEIHFHKFRC
jgi:hypothetical protein